MIASSDDPGHDGMARIRVKELLDDANVEGY